jgi:hypothetical protein
MKARRTRETGWHDPGPHRIQRLLTRVADCRQRRVVAIKNGAPVAMTHPASAKHPEKQSFRH